jgi:membrane protein YqaA with SNARE-associated domain
VPRAHPQPNRAGPHSLAEERPCRRHCPGIGQSVSLSPNLAFAYTLVPLKTLEHIFSRYTGFVWALLKPLGIWGIVAVAGIDGAFVGLPVDAVVAGYVYHNHSGFLLYVLLASVGSTLGGLVVYAIGYEGGEGLLRKRISHQRFEKIHSAFDKHPFWSLMLPAMLPPPTPFKLFALAAAISEMVWFAIRLPSSSDAWSVSCCCRS